MVAILTCVVAGFFTAFGWHGAQKVIDRVDPPTVEKRLEEKQ
jgi:hypothetical protein